METHQPVLSVGCRHTKWEESIFSHNECQAPSREGTVFFFEVQKNYTPESGEIAQQVRTLAILAEDLDTRIQMVAYNPL